MGRCLHSPPQQEPRRARKLPSPRSTRRPSPSIPPLRNVANATSKSTMNGFLAACLCVDLADVPRVRAEVPGADQRYGRHLLRALPPAGRHPARRDARNAALGDEPDLARGRELHHLPPGQGAVRQGQRRAPGRAGQDLRAGLRQRREKRPQGHPRQQGNLLRQDQRGRAWQQTSTTA